MIRNKVSSYDRMRALCQYHGIFCPEISRSGASWFYPGEMNVLGYYPTHDLLDKLDQRIGVDTRGGLHHDSFCRGYATPNNYVGTRIRLHEEYIRQDVPPYSFWLGASEAIAAMQQPVCADAERDTAGETVCGFRVAAYRETHPEHGDKFGHTYSEHWSTPSNRDPRVKVERLFTEDQLRTALQVTDIKRNSDFVEGERPSSTAAERHNTPDNEHPSSSAGLADVERPPPCPTVDSNGRPFDEAKVERAAMLLIELHPLLGLDSARRIVLTAGIPRSVSDRSGVELWSANIADAPAACHVMAARFDNDCGEWIYSIVLSPPSKPFTHWRMLPEPPALNPPTIPEKDEQ